MVAGAAPARRGKERKQDGSKRASQPRASRPRASRPRASVRALTAVPVVLLAVGACFCLSQGWLEWPGSSSSTSSSSSEVVEGCRPGYCRGPFSPADLKSPYRILGVDKGAKVPTIKKAYRRLSIEWHPDKHAGSALSIEVFATIANAHDALTDPEKRDVFDRLGASGLKRLQDGDPRVKKGWLPPEEVLRRHIGKDDPPLNWLDWAVTSVFALLEGKNKY